MTLIRYGLWRTGAGLAIRPRKRPEACFSFTQFPKKPVSDFGVMERNLSQFPPYLRRVQFEFQVPDSVDISEVYRMFG